MKRLHLIIYIMLACLSLHAQEADLGEQLLVFRKTGEVNLFFTNEVDSILTTDTTQVFYAKDTVLVVPFAELDSVAIGSRNEAVFLDGVKKLTTAADLPWIIRFDGQSIFYRKDTPANILPSVGMKLFYGLEEFLSSNTIFPYGLSAKVSSVTQLSEEIKVDIDLIELDEIFSRLFFAGRINDEMDASTRKYAPQKAPVNATLDLGYELPIGEIGNIDLHGKVVVKGDAVVGLRRSHANLDLEYGYGIGVKLKAEENGEINFEELSPSVKIGSFYGLLNIEAAVGAFADLVAKLNFGMDMERTYRRKLEWKREGDESSFEIRNTNDNESYEDKAKFELTLDGSLFFGPMLRIDFVTIGSLIGARAKVKVGPEVTGKFTLGMLHDMRNYDAEAYGNAELSLCGKLAVEGYVTHRKHLIVGEVEEHQLCSVEYPFGEHKLQLFPDYQESAAVAATSITEELNTEVATEIPEPPLFDLETGFEIVDPEGEIVDSLFVGTILAEPEEEVQTYEGEITMPVSIKQEQLEGYTMRPIFHYAGYTISAAPTRIRKDVLIQPYTATQSNGVMAFISSGPFHGSAMKDSTLYAMGTYLPVPPKKRMTYNTWPPIEPNQIITGKKTEDIIGTWGGRMSDENVILVFEEDGTGSMTKEEQTSRSYTYELNKPQTGELLIKYDEGFDNLLLRVLSVDETKLRVIDKRDSTKTIITFTRQ